MLVSTRDLTEIESVSPGIGIVFEVRKYWANDCRCIEFWQCSFISDYVVLEQGGIAITWPLTFKIRTQGSHKTIPVSFEPKEISSRQLIN